MKARGPRPQGSDARGDILAAARRAFADTGYDAVSLRGIAREAGVDPALVHHYFEGKAALFFAAVLAREGGDEPPIIPDQVVATVLAGPREQVGQRWVNSFLMVWDRPGGPAAFRALVHGVASSDRELAPLRQFLLHEIFGPVVAALGVDHPQARAELCGTQLIGLGMARYVGRLPVLAQLPPHRLVELVGPMLQHYLFDPIPGDLLDEG